MKLAVIGGDGIGPEVTTEALKVLRAVRSDIQTTDYDLGARRYLRNGELLTDADLASLREHDAILLGAIGAPGEVPPGVLERGLLLKMRFALDHHVNLRPSILYPTAHSPLANPGEIDFEEKAPQFAVSDTHWAKTWLLDEQAPKVAKPAVIADLHDKIREKMGFSSNNSTSTMVAT